MSCLHTAIPTPSYYGFGHSLSLHLSTFFKKVFIILVIIVVTHHGKADSKRELFRCTLFDSQFLDSVPRSKEGWISNNDGHNVTYVITTQYFALDQA